MLQQGVAASKNHQSLSLTLDDLAETPTTPHAQVLPSTVGGDLRPGKKPFVAKITSANDAVTKNIIQEGGDES